MGIGNDGLAVSPPSEKNFSKEFNAVTKLVALYRGERVTHSNFQKMPYLQELPC